jgi:DNA-binding IclR family transcriptional regulator
LAGALLQTRFVPISGSRLASRNIWIVETQPVEMDAQQTESSTLSSVERAVEVLKHVVFEQPTIGARGAARLLETSPSSAHRLLRTLTRLGLLEQDATTSKYGPGLELYRMAASLLASSELGQAARPPMERLARNTGEDVFLCVRSGDSRMVLDTASGQQQLKYSLPLGEEVPLHAGSSGLAILAWLPDEEVERILDGELARYTPNTLTDPAELRQAVQTIRAQGFAVSFGHHVRDGVGISAPVFGPHAQVRASVMLTIPESRLDRHDPVPEIGRRVRVTADAISVRLGGRPMAPAVEGG